MLCEHTHMFCSGASQLAMAAHSQPACRRG
jgi:hypothetical protein